MGTIPLKSKVWLCLAAGLVVGADFRRLSLKYFSPWIPPVVLLATTFLLLLIGLLLPYIWHARERKASINSYRLKALLEHAVIYALALDLSMFGWHKIEGLQMIVPLGVLDQPFSNFSGENLVWAFFKYSYPFTACIALLQIITAALLLFSKTRLFGLILAVPVLIFITSLDFFYHMPIGVLIHGIILLIGVFYFLSQDFNRLIDFIFQPMKGLNTLRIASGTKYFFRLSIFIWPIIFYLIYDYPDKHPHLTGKYFVQDLTVNQVPVSASSPKDSVLTNIYMDLEDEIVFDFNDYRYRYIGTYRLEEETDSIEIHWRYPSDTLNGFIGKLSKVNGQLVLEGEMNGEELRMKLSRVEKE
ncbi:hypothetical protein H8S90_00915 [Olivibacter sp. SDN3]|uniref:hypothetical protein n=1 Tax=Olivibacter sp. SDN3 TaxID=2764720 RepID=UPI00165118A1|nr:hypothetical protein [Olivibacter sp. SDN3]QNL50226.1 hypothetical protein H8S90_00915 [Olivibacter sp. SDN3]